MKTIFLFLISTLISTSVFAIGGTDVGRGGDSIALDFKSVALYNLNFIRQNAALSALINPSELERVIASATIEVQEQVFLGTVEKEALNFSNPARVIVGSLRWLQMGLNDPRKLALVLHEYLGIMGLDDSGYQYSNQFITALTNAKSQPLYQCTLIQDPKMKPAYRDTTRVGDGAGNSISHLGTERIQVQIYVGSNGSGNNDFLITFADGAKQMGMLELPRTQSFPKTVDLYSTDRNGLMWQVHCAQ